MDFDGMEKEELKRYLDFLFRQYRLVDAFWYIFIDEEQGSDVANHFNERVWERVAGLAARDIVERFGITDRGLDGFVQAQRMFPWSKIVGYQIDQLPDAVYISVPECPTQMARLQRNLGEYACKEMHFREFVSFSREINPAIKVECMHAPLDPHPADRFCRWKFTMGPEAPIDSN